MGKSSLLEALIKSQDPGKLEHFNTTRSNLMTHHELQISGNALKILDCSGNQRAEHLVKEWYARSHWVVVVYDLSTTQTLDAALAMVPDIQAKGASVLLFGNKHKVRGTCGGEEACAPRLPGPK